MGHSEEHKKRMAERRLRQRLRLASVPPRRVSKYTPRVEDKKHQEKEGGS